MPETKHAKELTALEHRSLLLALREPSSTFRQIVEEIEGERWCRNAAKEDLLLWIKEALQGAVDKIGRRWANTHPRSFPGELKQRYFDLNAFRDAMAHIIACWEEELSDRRLEEEQITHQEANLPGGFEPPRFEAEPVPVEEEEEEERMVVESTSGEITHPVASGQTQQITPPRVCPRCRGTMIAERDWYGSYRSCLNCGNVQELDSANIARAEEILTPSGGGDNERKRTKGPSTRHGTLRL